MLRRLGAVLLLLSAACVRPSISDDVSIEIEANDRVRVASQTTFNDADLKTPAALAKIDAARFAAQHGTDEWSARFARVTAEDESLTVEKHRGKITRVTRVVRIPVSDLQQVFADTNITINLLNGEGWRELAFYPGGSMRATREQQKHFENALTSWSGLAARYYGAIERLYFYLNANPQRAPDLFADLLGESGDGISEPAMLEEERSLVDAVKSAMEEIATRMDQQQDGAMTLAEEADLVFNPFPARMTVRVPGEVVSSEGFTKELVIEQVNLYEAIKALEGRWISPDPLVALLRDEEVKSSIMASQPRRSITVSATDIADALREQMKRPERYYVRWRDVR